MPRNVYLHVYSISPCVSALLHIYRLMHVCLHVYIPNTHACLAIYIDAYVTGWLSSREVI